MKKFKYNLFDELLDENNILSHVFLNTLSKMGLEKIAKENEGKEEKEIKSRKIEIELKINGESCDPKKFFEILYSQYSEKVRETATEIVKEQTSERLRNFSDKINEFEMIMNSWTNDINWNIDNPFLKTKE